MAPTEPPPDDDATQVGRNGWRQGSILAGESLAVLEAEGVHPLSPECVALVLSHDCDVVNASFAKEPLVELIWLSPRQRPDGRMTLGKNSRCLHLELEVPGARRQWFEALAPSRFVLSRRLLSTIAPSSDFSLPPGTKRLVSRWVAKRYDRSAFPTEFNRRLQGAKRLTRALETGGAWIEDLYVSVADDELPEARPYEIVLRAVLRVEDFALPDRRAQADHCLQELGGMLDDLGGITVVDAAAVSEAEFTLDDLRQTKRWDFNWLSSPGPQE
jgi:hypothetical protein